MKVKSSNKKKADIVGITICAMAAAYFIGHVIVSIINRPWVM